MIQRLFDNIIVAVSETTAIINYALCHNIAAICVSYYEWRISN